MTDLRAFLFGIVSRNPYFYMICITIFYKHGIHVVHISARGPQVSQSRFNPKSAPREDLGAVLKPNIEPKLDEYHWYFF